MVSTSRLIPASGEATPVMSRILLLTDTYPPAPSSGLEEQALALAAAGWTVKIGAHRVETLAARRLTASGPYQVFELPQVDEEALPDLRRAWRSAKGLGWSFQRLRSPILRRLAVRASALRGVIAEQRPALVHAYGVTNGLLASLALQEGEVPLAVDLQGRDLTAFPLEHGWAPFQLLRDARLVVHSAFAEARLRGGTQLRAQRIPLGCRLDGPPPPQRPATWPTDLVLLCVGPLERHSGFHLAIEAISRLRNTLPEHFVRLRICGTGSAGDDLIRFAGERGVTQSVEFAGDLSRVAISSELARAHLLLVPTVRDFDGGEEDVSRVALDGMASGAAVIAARLGGLAEPLVEGGFSVAPDDARALAATIEWVVRSRGPAEIALKAERAAAAFPLEATHREYESLARDLLRRAGRASAV